MDTDGGGTSGSSWLFFGLHFSFNLRKQLGLFIFVTWQLGEGLHQGRGWPAPCAPCLSRECGFPKAAWQMTYCIDLLSGEAQKYWRNCVRRPPRSSGMRTVGNYSNALL